MGRRKGARFQGKGFQKEASGTNDVDVDLYHCDQNYKLRSYPGSKTTNTGLVLVGILRSKKVSLPVFWFRWDVKDDKLEVNIHNVTDTERTWFENGEEGYQGRHPKRLGSAKRAFEVDIRIPDICVFHGCVSLGLRRQSSHQQKKHQKQDDEYTD